jgi:hypothetical protein
MVRAKYKEDDKQIPIGFGKEDVYILALQKSNRYNKWLDKRFSENYFGKYVFITFDQLNDPKYADTKKYRYIFDETEKLVTSGKTTFASQTASGSMASTDVFASFLLTDRATGIVYKSRAQSAGISQLMQQYLIKLEQIRSRNSSN